MPKYRCVDCKREWIELRALTGDDKDQLKVGKCSKCGGVGTEEKDWADKVNDMNPLHGILIAAAVFALILLGMSLGSD